MGALRVQGARLGIELTALYSNGLVAVTPRLTRTTLLKKSPKVVAM